MHTCILYATDTCVLLHCSCPRPDHSSPAPHSLFTPKSPCDCSHTARKSRIKPCGVQALCANAASSGEGAVGAASEAAAAVRSARAIVKAETAHPRLEAVVEGGDVEGGLGDTARSACGASRQWC